MPIFPGYNAPPGDDDFSPGTTIDSNAIDENFDNLESYLTGQFVDDGVIADQAIAGSKLTIGSLDGDRIAPGTIVAGSFASQAVVSGDIADDTIVDGDISPTADIDGSKLLDASVGIAKLNFAIGGSGTTPVGAIMMFAGAAAPAEWLLCDGSEISQTTYSALYSLIGTTYGVAADPVNDFVLPDLRSRMSVGTGSQNPLADNEGLAEGSRNSPSHTHGLTGGIDPAPDHQHGPGTLSVTVSGTTSTVSNSEFNQGFIISNSGASKITGNHGVVANDFLPTGGGSGAQFTKSLHRHTFSDSSGVTGNTSDGGAHGHTDTFSIDSAEAPYIVLTPIIYTGV